MIRLNFILSNLTIFLSLAILIEGQSECPVGKYQCLDTNKCIDLDMICNGVVDCQKMDDELDSYCHRKRNVQGNQVKDHKKKPTTNWYGNAGKDQIKGAGPGIDYWVDNWVNSEDGEGDYQLRVGCSPGRYQCEGTAKMCLRLDQICDGEVNCPFGDDENAASCQWKPYVNSRRKRSTENDFVNSRRKRSTENDFVNSRRKRSAENDFDGKANSKAISMNRNEKNEDKELKEIIKSLIRKELRNLDDNLIVLNGHKFGKYSSEEEQEKVNKELAFGKSKGFSFNVRNLIIYNSDVNMFNQKSDNKAE